MPASLPLAVGTPDPAPPFWFRWLQVATPGTILFGLALVVLPDRARRGVGLSIYGESDALWAFGAGVQPYPTLSYAVMGSVMVGWGSALWLTLTGPLRPGERHGRNVFAVSRSAWFVPDTAASLSTGL